MKDKSDLPIIVGITGASGAIYGITLVKFLLENNYSVDLVLSPHAEKVFLAELGFCLGLDKKNSLCEFLQINEDLGSLRLWDHNNVAAAISSGSYKTQGMIIAPCSMGSIGNIAAGTSNNLLTRAADVCLKERRKLVLVARETPLSTIHLRNMLSLSEIGAVILPAAPGFYHNPRTIQDQVNFILGKALDAFGIENENFTRWLGDINNQLLKY
jgi:4-hydroxy-3-polyprenylbenzoate decarboxylase